MAWLNLQYYSSASTAWQVMPCVAETAFNLDTSVSASCEIHLWYRALNLLRANFVAKQLLYPLEKKKKQTPRFWFWRPQGPGCLGATEELAR